MGEVAARHAVDISVTEVQVAYYMSDGSTARAQYPSTNTDPTAAVEALLKEKKQSGAALAVDSPHVLNDVVRCHPGGFVDEQQSLDWRAVLGRSISLRLVHARRWSPAA